MNQYYPQPGTLLAGRYRVVRFIGRGGMGVVLEAKNTVTQRDVAIKWMVSDFANSPEATERLMREATAAARIQHPNVVDVYDVMQDGSSVFLVMELLRGEPLQAVLDRGGMPVHELIALLLPAMEGVAEAHRQDIVHRDIHPGNIFIADEGRPARRVSKVLDFGISKLGGTDKPALTRSNISMGTPLYMSYEQLYSARDVDKRTDVYSFGVILYEALTGKLPFDAESFVEVAGKITAGTVVHPKELRPDLPNALAELVLRAMARNREERIDSMETLMQELAPFATEHGFRAQMKQSRGPLPLMGAGPATPVGNQALSALDLRAPARQHTASPSLPGTGDPRRDALLSAGRIDTDGHISRPLAHSSTRAGRPSGGARTAFLLVGALAFFLVGLGVWLVRGRSTVTAEQPIADVAQPPAVPQPPAAKPADPPVPAGKESPGTPPSAQHAEAQRPAAQPIAPSPAPTPAPGTLGARKPLWLQRWEAARASQLAQQAQQAQQRAQKGQKPAAPPARETPRAGPLRDEDL